MYLSYLKVAVMKKNALGKCKNSPSSLAKRGK
jgi:hypothetical protein